MRVNAIRLAMTASVAGLLVLGGSQALAGDDAGKTLYIAKCASCHGADGVAKEMWAKKGMKNLNDAAYLKGVTDAQLTKDIADGIPEKKMPAYKDKMTAEDIQALVKHIRGLAAGS